MDQPKSGVLQRREAHAASGGGREKPDKPKKDKKGKAGGSKRNRRNKKDSPAPMTRVVIRRLPPTMTEELFREQISVDGQMPDHDEFYFVGPDWSLARKASCRAYLNFTNPEDIFRFTDSFDGYTFVDNKGMEYQAVVEYAPFQRLSKNRSRKKDLKCNTIETDTHFIAFKEALELEEKEALQRRGTQEFSFKLEQEKKTTTTPLLEYIAQRKQEKRDEKRRKQEEKRKSREEERQMRKTQIAKAIPDAIREEAEFNQFMERTVLPRLGGMSLQQMVAGSSGASENRKTTVEAKSKDEKDKKSKNKKEKDKNRDKKGEDPRVQDGGKADDDKSVGKKQERDKGGKKPKDKPGKEENRKPDQQQQPQQQQQKGDRPEKAKKEKPPPPPSVGGSDQASSSKANPTSAPASSSGKKEVKKYSERRKETRARAETRFAEHDPSYEAEAEPEVRPTTSDKVEVKKTILTANVPPFIPKEKTTILLAGHSSKATNNPAVITPSSSSAERVLTSSISDKPAANNGKKSPLPDGAKVRAGPDEKVPGGKGKESREARKIRNKDRPSIEIYQPRKRMVSGGAGKSEDDRGRSDSDRPSDNVSAAASTVAAERDEGATNERRHKLTKKASDRQQRERKNGRKNSVDSEGSKVDGGDWWI